MPVLAPDLLFDGRETLRGAAVRIDKGRVVEILPTAPLDIVKLAGLLAPGFIDIQVNGGGGVLFNDDATAAALRTIVSAHTQFGVTGLMATLVSDDRRKIVQALDAVSEAIAQGLPGLLGLHLEGPWLSEPRRGVHPAKFLRTLDDEDIRLLTARRAYPLLVTLAPEQVDTTTVSRLAAANVRINIGHTAASAELVEAMLAAGATGFTHLFNAMPPLEGRNPGAVGAALAHREAWAGLILDGVHVHPTSARAAFAAKTADKLILVSDAMSTVGSKDASMSLFGEKISVSGGALRTSSGTLAGAHLDLAHAVRNATALLGASREEALRMASRTPAEFLGVGSERGSIVSGCRADFVLLDSSLNAKATWIGGDQVA